MCNRLQVITSLPVCAKRAVTYVRHWNSLFGGCLRGVTLCATRFVCQAKPPYGVLSTVSFFLLKSLLHYQYPIFRGVNQKVFFSRSIAVLRHKNERNLCMMLQNTLFSVFLTMLYNE